MIKNFKDKDTEKIWNNIKPKRFSKDLCKVARRKLRMIDSATNLEDLKVPPNNRLEPLKGDRTGQQCIRINQQWRICFVEKNGDFFGVEIVDYH